jgi:hypothetical protein
MATVTSSVAFDRPSSLRDLIAAKAGRVRFLVVPDARHLAVDGSGTPGGDEFREAFGALYPVAYTLHFALKRRGITAPVGALEGLYWLAGEAPVGPADFAGPGSGADGSARALTWRLMLPIPSEATDEDLAAAVAEVEHRKAPPALARLRSLRWDEGPSAQILHVGPYATEPETIETLHRAIAGAGLRPRGRHHEIYLSDPNRTAPDRVKTVIRQPVEADA